MKKHLTVEEKVVNRLSTDLQGQLHECEYNFKFNGEFDELRSYYILSCQVILDTFRLTSEVIAGPDLTLAVLKRFLVNPDFKEYVADIIHSIYVEYGY